MMNFKKYEVGITFNVPKNVTFEEFEEYLRFHLGYCGYSTNNPLYDKDLSDIVANYHIRRERGNNDN